MKSENQSDSVLQKCLPENRFQIRQYQNWFMEEVLVDDEVHIENSNQKIKNQRWAHDSIRGAYIGSNGWSLGGDLVQEAHILWEFNSSDRTLDLDWFMGGYHRDYDGRPESGWGYENKKGGNNVKAYPRIGIGTASGQPNASWGAPEAISKVTHGIRHLDMDKMRAAIGLPARYKDAPNIRLNVDVEFTGGSLAVPKKDRYGNFFFAIDSYFHDIDTPHFQLHPNFAGTLDGINDSSGKIYDISMEGRQHTSKRWAMMVWYAKSAYYETSGGIVLADNVMIGGRPHVVKYKLENASHHKFHYAAFIMKREVEELYAESLQPQVLYNAYADFLTDGRYQTLLNQYMSQNGNLVDLDGRRRRIQAPNRNSVLSDVNIGVEILSNPDTESDQTPRPVRLKFKRVSFDIEGKGNFGFEGFIGGSGGTSLCQ